jgi:SAM-dependent methyltransferase
MFDQFSTDDWHNRYLTQSRWTNQLRKFIYSQIGISSGSKILEVGCGTGVITNELRCDYSAQVFGIDISLPSLQKAQGDDFQVNYTCADANYPPFSDGFFDFVVCHYFLLWVPDPMTVLKEIIRVLKPGGFFVALAEPDYSSRIDFPQDFEKLGRLQRFSLVNQGADPAIGKTLPRLMFKSGFSDVQFGVSGFQENPRILPETWESEWKVLRSDLRNTLSTSELDILQNKDFETRNKGERVMWVPTFYAFGKNSSYHK